jgi:hypothetical protein
MTIILSNFGLRQYQYKGGLRLKNLARKRFIGIAISLLWGLLMIGGWSHPDQGIANAATVKAGNFSVAYQIQSDWGNGASVKVTVKNNTAAAINNWGLSWTFPGNQKMTLIQNATATQSGATVTVRCKRSNTSIPGRGQVSFIFRISYSGTNGKPTRFTLTYTPTATTAPTATPRTTPAATPTRTPASTPTATATASNTGKTFYTTSVNDGLDANDRVLFESKFKNIGYTLSGSNTNVSSTQLNTLLSRTDLDIIYHTGHGYDSGIATSGGGYLSVDNVTGVNTSTAIFATCLTLTSTSWKKKMNSSCNNLLGYTNYSYDSIDDTIVDKFAVAVKSGNSIIQAWYTSNTAVSYLSDRWCGYVRENNSIVEYSARTGSTPKNTVSSFKKMDAQGTVKVATTLLADTNNYDSYFFKIRNSEIKVKGVKTHDARFYRKTAEFLPKVKQDRGQAVTVAQNWVSGSLPVDAKQESVTQIIVTEASGATKVVGQVVRYTRYVDGLPVRSNGPEDHLAVLVNSGSVAAVSKLWPVLEVKSKPGVIPSGKILTLSQAIQKASPNIARIVKAKSIAFVAANPCYGTTKSGAIVPAYELIDSKGGRIIINAMTGKLVF